jgi:hypothetical protein
MKWCKNNQINSETKNSKTGFSQHRWMLHAKQMPTHRIIWPSTLVYQTNPPTATSVEAMDIESMSDQLAMTAS